MSQSRILLTGATGFLGEHLSPHLAELGDCVGVGFRAAPASGHQVDLTDRDATHALLDRVRPQILVHAAALTDVDQCERDPAATYRSNVEATRHLVDWVLAEGVETQLIYISTDQVYDAPGPSREETALPINVYAMTKLWAEDLVRRHERHLVLRTNFFGLGNERHRTFLDWVVESSRARREITLFEDVFFNPLHVDDLSAVIARLISDQAVGTYNLGASGGGLSKARFIRLVAAHFDLPTESYRDGSLDDVGLAARRPRDMRMALTRIESQLGETIPTVADGISRLVLDAPNPASLATG